MTETVEVQESDRAVLTEPAQDQPRQKPLRAHAERIVEAGRSQVGRARQLRDDERVRARAHRMRTALGELRDGLEASRRDADQEFLRQFHVRGDLNLPVKPELLSAYQRERDRIENKRRAEAERRANRTEWEAGLEFAQRNAGTLTGGGGLAVAFSDLLGILPVPNAAALLGGAVGCGLCWLKARSLRKAGREYRAVQAQRAGYLDPQAPEAGSLDEDGAIDASFFTAVLQDAGVLSTGSGTSPEERAKLAEEVVRDEHGWVARIVLPGTKSASAVVKAHERITSALGPTVSRQQVRVTVETPRVVRIRKYDRLPFTGDPVPHPLLGTGQDRSIKRDGVPIGLDINGNTIMLYPNEDLHGLVIAASGMGKTVHVRNLALSVLHSSDAEIGGIFDGKASGDYDAVRQAVSWYLDTMESGAGWWDLLADALDGEVDEAMARQQRIRRGETLGLRFVILDEFQVAFGSPGDRKKGSPAARIVAACEELSRLGRSSGVRLILASQSYDGNVMPSGILNNFLWRLVGYISSETMDPKDTVGREGVGMGLIPDQEFTKAQKGAAIALSGSLPDEHAVCRGWFQDDEVIADDVASVVTSDDQHQDDAELPGLLAALEAYVRERAGEGDDRAVIPTGELYREANPEGLNPRVYGDTLAKLGIGKVTTDPDTGRTLRNPGRSVADIRKAVLAARSAA